MNNANKLNDKYNKAQKLNIETDTANKAVFFTHYTYSTISHQLFYIWATIFTMKFKLKKIIAVSVVMCKGLQGIRCIPINKLNCKLNSEYSRA